jgi:hypothetical protein
MVRLGAWCKHRPALKEIGEMSVNVEKVQERHRELLKMSAIDIAQCGYALMKEIRLNPMSPEGIEYRAILCALADRAGPLTLGTVENSDTLISFRQEPDMS